MGDDELRTTIVSNPTIVEKFFLCLCFSSSLPLTKFYLRDKVIDAPLVEIPMSFKSDFLKLAERNRLEGNKEMLHHVESMTASLQVSVVQKCIPSRYTNVRPLTCGGMSRIYAARSPTSDVVIKITDCSKGLGMYEYECFERLASKGFRIPHIHYMAMYGRYHIMILSRHAFTLSTFLITLAEKNQGQALSEEDECLLGAAVSNLKYILRLLRHHDISFCDLSPDNIMVDINPVNGHGRFVLIDPQFAVPSHPLAKKIGRRWAENIDRVHFAFKIRTLAASDPRLTSIADFICLELLGYIPTECAARKWVLTVLPHGLRIAHDCLAELKSKKRV